MKNWFSIAGYKVGAAVATGAALLPAFTFAEGSGSSSPVGVLDTFDISTAGTTIRDVVLTVLGVVGTIYGAVMGFHVLRWAYRKVRSGLM